MLKILFKRNEIVNAIAENEVVIIKGTTGCGKTTQVPQFIYDSCKEKSERCNIIITQPRKMAAYSCAVRVSKERNCRLNSVVGYQIGSENKCGEATVIRYVSIETLLQKLISNRNLDEFTHYVIDEIHERTQVTDFVLVVVRKFLKSSNAKLIVMSATMDTEKLSNYLAIYDDNGKKILPCVVDIDESTLYKVHEFFLDDLCCGESRIPEATELIPFAPAFPMIEKNAYKSAARIIQQLDRIDWTEDLHSNTLIGQSKAWVLVFLPGVREIQSMENVLKELSSPEQLASLEIRPLYSSMPREDQRAIFQATKHTGTRKIILATNIAESSVTLNIRYVIDFCLEKRHVIDSTTGCTSIKSCWASKNSLIQRAGRVGRISDGRVFRIISKDFFKAHLKQESSPEILHQPLENLILNTKLLKIGPPENILAEALDPPSLENIHQAVVHLKGLGALLQYTENEKRDLWDGAITFMGTVLAELPLDVSLGKLVFLGNELGVTEDCVIIACAMATKNIISFPHGKDVEAYDARLWWADSSFSDCIAFLNAYKEWKKISNPQESSSFAWNNYLESNALRELHYLESDVVNRLKQRDWYRMKNNSDNRSETLFLLQIAIIGAFYPNYFLYNSDDASTQDERAIHILGNRDPLTTVYFRGLPLDQPPTVYKKSIIDLFRDIPDRLTEVNFDSKGKAFVTFHPKEKKSRKETTPRKIADTAVYHAIKMRHTEEKLSFPRMTTGRAWKTFLQSEYDPTNVDGDELRTIQMLISTYPSLWRKNEWLDVTVCHVKSYRRFWVRSLSKAAGDTLSTVLKVLNTDGTLIQLSESADLAINSIYVALQPDEEIFFRVRIKSKSGQTNAFPKKYTYTVNFIDHGSSQSDLPADQIYNIESRVRRKFLIDEVPNLAVECTLEDQSQDKTQKTVLDLTQLIHEPAKMKIFSIIDNTLKVKIVVSEDENHSQHTFKFGCDESHTYSVSHHHEKLEGQKRNFKNPRKTNEDPKKVLLQGPFSPLEITQLAGMTISSFKKKIDITRNSVNSVLLQDGTDLSGSEERMIVAASIVSNVSGKVLFLKHTTLMPSIPALPTLSCLVFAPMVNLKCDSTKTTYCGATCGYNGPLCPDDNVELVFHYSIGDTELELINTIRSHLSNLVNPRKNEHPKLNETRLQLREYLRKLFLQDSFKLKKISSTIDLHGRESDPFFKADQTNNDVYKPINLWANKLSEKQIHDVIVNLYFIRKFADHELNMPTIKCKICKGEILRGPTIAIEHLKSSSHRVREERYQKFYRNEYN